MVGELAAGHVADVQLQLRSAQQARGLVGHGIGAPAAVAQHHLDILAGVKAKHLAGRQLQEQAHHVGRELLVAG